MSGRLGLCPRCKAEGEYVNVRGPQYGAVLHWNLCGRCKNAWFIGMGLFSLTEEDTEPVMAANMELLKEYEAVEPYYP